VAGAGPTWSGGARLRDAEVAVSPSDAGLELRDPPAPVLGCLKEFAALPAAPPLATRALVLLVETNP
jgi:hypothetical protein